jgi:dolichyl-phosphate beta-glucosyltransferase
MYLSIVIPAYNEAKRIGLTLKSVGKYMADKDYQYEIIVVNDGSQDGTREIVEGLKSEVSNIKVVDYADNKGKGYAVRQGMLKAIGDVRLFMDADNSTTIDNLDRMKEYMDNGFDVAIASIGAKGSKSIGHEPFYRRFFGKVGNLFIRFIAVSGIKDTQRGFKVFTARSADVIFNRARENGWGFDVEILAIAKSLGFKIKEVPVVWNNNPDSKVSLRIYPRVLISTIRVRFNLLFGKYDK